jgi:hypothetical protein
VTIASLVTGSAQGTGGGILNGIAGTGKGGRVALSATDGGAITFSGAGSSPLVSFNASGTGGYAEGQSGTAGDGESGLTEVSALSGGVIAINGAAALNSDAFGGNGGTGGAASGNRDLVGGVPVGAVSVSANGGTITVTGALTAEAQATGGRGFSPAGAGGSAQGGAISIAAAAGGATNSAITLNDVTIVADGLGGAGGSALPPDEPGNGGAGGAGFGGSVTLLGQAGGNSSASTSGLLTTGNVTLSANGIGGTGGNGDAGGAGGAGTAGVLSFGANSLVGANGSGGAVFGNVTGTVNAVGGDGGAGSSGTGGVGGNAIANAVRTQLIADGASVSAGTVSLTSGASGGAGQGGSSGGNATSNGIDVIVNGRAGDMVRGALNLASFQSATQSQVSGSAPGTAYFGDGSTVSVTNGDVTTGSFGMTVGSGVAALSAVAPSRIFLRNATFNGTGAFSVSTPGNLSVFADNSALNVSTISLHAADFVADPISGGAFQPGVLAAAGGADIVSANNIILSGSLHTGSSLSLNASGFISASDLQSAGDVLVEGQMGVTLRDLTSGGMIDVDSGAAIAIRNAVAGGDVVLDALGNIDAGALMAGASVLAQSGGNIVVSGLATAGIVNPSSAAGTSYDIGMGAAGLLSTADLRSAGRIGLAAGSGTLDTGLISAGTDVLLLSGGNMTVGGISSAGGATSNIYIASSSMLSGPPTEDFDPAPIFAATPVALAGDVTIGGPVMGGALRLAATGRVTLGDVTTNGEFVGSGGAITTGNMSVGGLLQLTGAGDIGLGTATGTGDVVLSSSAGSVALASVAAGNALLIQANGPVGIAGAASAGVNGSVGIASGGDIGFGSLSAGRDVTLVSTSGAIRGTGAIASGTDVLLLARTGATTGGISTPATGRITIADSAMAALGGSFGSGFDTAAIFAATPVSMNGAIVITDAVTTGTLNMAGLTGISLTSVTASNAATIRTENGLLSLSAVLRSPVISLLSNDIAIGNDAGINAGLSGTVIIASSNATGMRIGDAATGGGYVLDRAEFSRINSGTLTIGGPATASARIAMTIGDLDVTGPLAGSTIDAPDGKVVFFTGDLASGIRSGVIRVTGSLRARGFLPTNGITFSTGRFEMDAQTGLVEIVGQGTALGGTITFDTPQVNVAEAAILNRLAQDPRYAGRAVDLNTPLAAAHPGGIIRAGVIDVSAANAVLIQNSGTANQPAGFLATSIVGLSRNGNSAPGALDFIINGQLVGTNGTVTGKDVLDLLVQDSIRANFTPESSINACLISTISCLVVTPNADADADALAGRFLQSDNLLVTNERLGGGDPDMARGGDASGETEEQRRQREQVEQEISKAPILPPTPIIDSGPLDPPINVDEPVAGSGNPALINGAADTVIGRGKL